MGCCPGVADSQWMVTAPKLTVAADAVPLSQRSDWTGLHNNVLLKILLLFIYLTDNDHK